MEILENGDDLLVTCCHPGDPDMKSLLPMFMGKSTYRNSPRVRVENNVVNRIVLGLDPLGYQKEHMDIVDESWGDPLLDDYQRADVQKGAGLINHLNRNKMGLGKTPEAIKIMKAWHVQDAVIVAPKNVCPQWVTEIRKWYPEVSERVGLYDFKAPIIVTNYEKLLQPARLNSLRNYRREVAIFDEIHFLKNRNSQRTNASLQIPAKAHIGLTGTPILKHPDDLWSILNVIDWHYSGKSYWNFVDYFCNVVDGYFGREIQGVTKNASRLAILHKLLSLVSMYNDIVVGCGKRVVEVNLPMESAQAELYKKIKRLTLDELPEKCTIANGAVLALRLQQTTSWPGLFDVKGQGAKFNWIETFCSGTDEQIVIFTKFEKTARALSTFLTTKKIHSVLYTGQVSEKQKQINKAKFMAGDVQVFIGTIAAVGTGTDGLQEAARLGIMVEKDWSPEINSQCEDRLNRRGQKLPVMWYYLNCEKSFDQRVGKINLSKAEAIRVALEVDE